MTASNIPDSFNMDSLEELLNDAPREEDIHAESHSDIYSEDVMVHAAKAGLDSMTDLVPDPAVHKAALLKICTNMINWHTAVGENANEEGHTDCGTAWMRDAGKWQAIMNIARGIDLGENDHWCDVK